MNFKFRKFVRLRKWPKTHMAAAAIIFTAVVAAVTLIVNLSRKSAGVYGSTPPPTSNLVDLTLSRVAKERGAYCLDGSLPGYHFQKGFGPGTNNWLLYMEGGGWCSTTESCSFRKRTALGSSQHMESQVPFSGILSYKSSENPDFFNWNKVVMRYCDGASFAGNPESELKNETGLFFRGELIWKAMMEELLAMGLSSARQALLSGCSAGGLATLIHCDDFKDMLSQDTTVKCLSDAGFFLDEKDIAGNFTLGSLYHNVVNLQGVAKSLQKDCITKTEPCKCFFPREILKNTRTPVFLVNPAYDFWQIRNVLAPDSSDPGGSWEACKRSIQNCNDDQLEILHGFRGSMLAALDDYRQNKELGMFINSCFAHCQTWLTAMWHSSNSPRIRNLTIAESVGEWFFDRGVVKLIDCAYPCNPTCYTANLP